MSGQIKTPTNQKLLTNVAVVRMKKCGKRYEVACYKNKVLNWRNKMEKDIDEVLQTQTVFVNVSKGQLAKRDDLQAAFGTEDQLEICKMGDLQVSDKERQVTSESSIKEVANLITNMCVNPETQRPYSLATIEKALHDAHFSLKNNRSTKQQALEMIPKLRESLKIDRAKMRIRVSVPGKNAKMLHSKLKAYFDTVEVEDWDKGDLEMVGLIEPGSYKAIVELVKGDKKEKLEQIGLELLSLKVIGENEVEVS
uniref:Ribosome maturation protein SBDS n=1 Tax=Globodera pallida TaxID=36090 RepID=A0A183BVH9_GLOPA